MWAVGDVVRDTFLVPISPDAEGPVAATVEVGLYRLETMRNLPVLDASGKPVGQPIIGRVKIAVPTGSVQPSHALDANLGDRVRLIGYDLDLDRVRPGSDLPITLYWQVTGSLDKDYTVFIHLLDGDETITGQGDGPPLEGSYPTSFWGVGETLTDRHRLRVHQDAPPGNHRIAVGLYDLNSGLRLPVLDAAGKPVGDRVLLATISVVAESALALTCGP